MIPKAILEEAATPYYCYDLSMLSKTLESCKKEAQKYNYKLHYALKANVNEPILHLIRDNGFGADCVSGQEVRKAYDSGFSKEKIVFAGVGKSDAEILTALDIGISCFNCESAEEIEVIHELAALNNSKAKIAIRINPNVDAQTHHYITTGLNENKFGVNSWELDSILDRISTLDNIELVGIHFHIGSQITDLLVFERLCSKVNTYLTFFKNRGIPIRIVNVGGGLGVDYFNPIENPVPDFKAFFALFKRNLNLDEHQELHFELGRSLVAQCGFLVTRVLYVKRGLRTNFAIVDAGMTELLRPALYQSYHKIENYSSLAQEIETYDVVGPICESSDCFAKSLSLPATKRGDLLIIFSVGAYGEVMSFNYNMRSKVASYYF